MYKRIVAGVDDSPTAAEAAAFAINLARLCGAELHLVTAYRPGRAGAAGGLPDDVRYSLLTNPADRLLSQLAAAAREASLDPVVHPAGGEPADAITAVAAQEEADLIVVGNKGMKGVRRVLGSVPHSVAHQAPCSVLIVDTTG